MSRPKGTKTVYPRKYQVEGTVQHALNQRFKSQNWTRDEASERTGYSYAYLTDVLNGKSVVSKPLLDMIGWRMVISYEPKEQP